MNRNEISPSIRTTGDKITFAFAIGAAMSSAAFAGYMWTTNPAQVTEERLIFERLPLAANGEGRTNVRPIKPTTGEKIQQLEADPITTASSTARTTGLGDATAGKPGAPARSLPGQLDQFVLLGIFADTALVAGTGPDSHRIWSVKVGSTVPGAGRVIAFDADQPNASVLTTRGLISALEDVQR